MRIRLIQSYTYIIDLLRQRWFAGQHRKWAFFNNPIIAIIVIGLCLSACDQVASDHKTLFDHANVLYANTQYDKASDLYQDLINQLPDNGYIWANYGRILYKQQQLESALYAMIQANHLLPRNPDIHADIELIQKKLSISEISVSLPWLRSIALWMQSNMFFYELVFISIVLFAIASVLISIRLLRYIPFLNVVIPVIAMSVIVFISACMIYYIYDQPIGIALSNNIELKQTPSHEGKIIHVLAHGTRCFILSRVDDWAYVQSISNQMGWVNYADVVPSMLTFDSMTD